MTQVSKVKLDKVLEEEMFSQFWRCLAKVNTSEKSSDFFSDFFTKTEKTMLAKRFSAAILVIREKSATEIRKALHLSYSAIGVVSAWVNNSKPKTKEILINISKEKDLESMLDKIDSLIDKIPPRRHSDWKEEFSKRNKSNRKRSVRKTLR